MSHSLPALPYAKDALAPHISAETLEYHYGKHHNAYVSKLNALLEGHALAGASLEDVINHSSGGIFNSAAQHFNHTFYWNSLSPNGGGAPTGDLAKALADAFGSVDGFKTAFTNEAAGHFGSGWAWLVRDADGSLAITSTHDADSPIAHGQTPLLTCDVWEHAYYIDYRNARASYIDAFWNIVNWDHVARQAG